MIASNPTSLSARPISARRSVLLETSIVRKQRIFAWFTVVVPTLATFFAVGRGIVSGMPTLPLALFFVFYFLTLMGITVGFHRFFAHRSFKTGRGLKNVFAILGTLAAQGPIIHWVSNHRRHHNLSDRTGDPHSPNLHGTDGWSRAKGLFHAHIGSMFAKEVTNYAAYSPDLLRDSDIVWINKRYLRIVAAGLVIPTAVGLAVTQTTEGGLTALLWGGFVRMFVVHHAIWSITSVAHTFGKKRFAARDESRNSLWLAVLTGGEGWHNTHHAFPGSAIFSTSAMELDIGGLFVISLKRLGLVWDVATQAEKQSSQEKTI